MFFSLAPVRAIFWLPPGYVDPETNTSLTVTDVEPGGAAQRAGIHVGDRFDPSTSFEDRLYLEQIHNPRAGQVLTLRVMGKTGSRIVRLRSGHQGPYGVMTAISACAGALADLIFVVVGSILVLLRPSKMTWAFFFYSVAIAPFLVLGTYWLPSWFIFSNGVFADALRAFGFAAFLIFCARAPNDNVTAASYYVELLAPLVFISLLVCGIATNLSILGVLHVDQVAGEIQSFILMGTYAVGIATLILKFLRERGTGRSRVGWIIAGFAVGLGSRLVANLINDATYMYTGSSEDVLQWPRLAAEVLPVAIPFGVAYAVVRHHALNAGAIANRTIVYGLAACMAFALFALLDVLATKQFAHNGFEIGADIAVALAIGLSFQFWHPRAIRLIDRVFLPDRYRAAIALDGLRETLGTIRSADEAPNRAVETVAKELMLSSLAIFKKVPDGGFVRYAAAGWPKGSAWHVYAADPLSQSFREGSRVRTVNAAQTAGLNVPPEPNQPTMGMLLSPQTTVESLILVGAHVNGRRPDHDEVRGIAALLREHVRRSFV